MVLFSNVEETRLEWHFPAKFFFRLTQCGTKNLNDCTRQGHIMPWSGLPLSASSACLRQVGREVRRGHAVLDLGVGDCSMLLTEV